VINSSYFQFDSMPLDKETRRLIELATWGYLRSRKEATSNEILLDLTRRSYRAAFDVRQVAVICSAMQRKGVLLSHRARMRGTRLTFWSVNPKFHNQHPGESVSGKPMSKAEYCEAIKRRMRKTRKRKQKEKL